MKIPDESHPITITRAPNTVRVLFEGHEIADSDDVLVLKEASYPPVFYFPRGDVQMDFLRRTDKVTHCPYKGDAAYFTLYRDRQIIENAVWSYETPYDAVDQIAGRVAFYPEHVEFELGDRTAGRTEATDVDEVVRHTDSGAGTSQAEHWKPNVEMPDPNRVEHDLDQPYKGVGAI
ncbi:DUF427 domain-containing protein [Caulobacter sp. RL271]|jgi:uncharacterized protein (DUF427 family)|uniref:DUF427 domain-containing protein n=1 Tax=Caulobacter segnis TaxID=88688 RepID=A0ABY4ZWV5_9CAUL|nr:DUF427 domain-containing protein [Caulobacter segnis]USQ96381.1 DUF427 domain-containing protein [Caulobacter segnis]